MTKQSKEEEKMNAFEQIKSELIRRGYDSARADAQAASYTRGMNDDAILTDEDVGIACDQIDEW